MATKNAAEKMLEHNNKHCGFMSDELNDLVIFSHHSEKTDYGVFHATKDTLLLINEDEDEILFRNHLADSIWLPIIRSMTDGVSTVTINEMFELLKSRNDFKKISEIPDDVFKLYGQHEADIVVVHEDQHIAGFVITDIQAVNEMNSLVVAEVAVTGASLEIDLDNGRVEQFSIPAFTGLVNIQLPVPADVIPQNQSFTKSEIKIGEHTFALNLLKIAKLRRVGFINI